ncbi:hypothetical protein [Aquitalea magnusonii]|uniref:hypothetical protein n=1 Tax=Aquitalea magnusonii TaxID=332411 RepID=UPI0011B3B60A|nr:hypothetical protein [Aquitalea magnusonii]
MPVTAGNPGQWNERWPCSDLRNIAQQMKHILYTSSDCDKKEKPNMRKCSVLLSEQGKTAGIALLIGESSLGTKLEMMRLHQRN